MNTINKMEAMCIVFDVTYVLNYIQEDLTLMIQNQADTLYTFYNYKRENFPYNVFHVEKK